MAALLFAGLDGAAYVAADTKAATAGDDLDAKIMLRKLRPSEKSNNLAWLALEQRNLLRTFTHWKWQLASLHRLRAVQA